MHIARALPPTLVVASVAAIAAIAARAAEREPPAAERGRYLVHQVAMCVQCHSPRDEAGDLIATKLLQGAPLPVASPYRDLSFAAFAPRLAGLPGYSEKEAIRLLTSGLNRDGKTPRPPMPPFRMSPEDARAVFAYLKSLEKSP